MRKIPLTHGLFAMIDDADYKLVSRFKWYANKTPGSYTYYAVRIHHRRYMAMHRLIMGVNKKVRIDHANRNGLDNRRGNLRTCTMGQNLANAKKRIGSTSAFKGVSWEKRRKKWRATVNKDCHQFYLGTFSNQVEAARHYDDAARRLFGEFARTNFR